MQITQDKFQETTYHFSRLKAKLDEIINEKDFNKLVYSVIEFRYELNACVNSYRATTFALQSEHRKKFGEKFEKWYQVAKDKITSDQFSKIIQELRNINQKEGNIYPTFQFEGESDEAIIFFEIDYTSKDTSFIIRKGLTAKVGLSVELSDILPGEPLNKFTIDDENRMNAAAAKFFGEQQNKIFKKNQFKLQKIKIDRFQKEYSPSEFLENFVRMGNLLREIVKDGWLVFQ
jgi:hypothetical protein